MLTSSALLSAFLTLSFSSSWASPAHSYTILLVTLLFQLCSLCICSLFCLCSLCLHLTFSPSLSVSCSAPASLVARSGLLGMFSLSLSLSALDDSRCPWMFSISYLQQQKKNLSLTILWGSHVVCLCRKSKSQRWPMTSRKLCFPDTARMMHK